jgi:hypothetical protein
MNRSLKMSNNTEFQVGDRVEFVENYSDKAWIGSQGVITERDPFRFDPEHTLAYVKLDGADHSIGVYEFRLKHVEATPVPKEFRFFRRSDAAISDIPYVSFEEALAGWKVFAQDGNEVEIIEIIPHGKYKAVLKIEEA